MRYGLIGPADSARVRVEVVIDYLLVYAACCCGSPYREVSINPWDHPGTHPAHIKSAMKQLTTGEMDQIADTIREQGWQATYLAHSRSFYISKS